MSSGARLDESYLVNLQQDFDGKRYTELMNQRSTMRTTLHSASSRFQALVLVTRAAGFYNERDEALHQGLGGEGEGDVVCFAPNDVALRGLSLVGVSGWLRQPPPVV